MQPKQQQQQQQVGQVHREKNNSQQGYSVLRLESNCLLEDHQLNCLPSVCCDVLVLVLKFGWVDWKEDGMKGKME